MQLIPLGDKVLVQVKTAGSEDDKANPDEEVSSKPASPESWMFGIVLATGDDHHLPTPVLVKGDEVCFWDDAGVTYEDEGVTYCLLSGSDVMAKVLR